MAEKERLESKQGGGACIILEVSKTSLAGGVLESQRLMIEGQDLDEVRQHFDDIWGVDS